MEITLKEVEINKLQLEPGDVVVIKIKSDYVDQDALGILKNQFEKTFEGYEVKLVLFNMGLSDDLSFDVIRENKDNKVGKCSNCSCKKGESNADYS